MDAETGLAHIHIQIYDSCSDRITTDTAEIRINYNNFVKINAPGILSKTAQNNAISSCVNLNALKRVHTLNSLSMNCALNGKEAFNRLQDTVLLLP